MLGNSSIARRKKTPNKPHRRLLLETLEKRELLANWYAAPDGLDSNSGAIDSPWDLTSALVNTDDVGAGDTIWLRGGTYYYPDRSSGVYGYAFNLQGASGSPVVVRPHQDEHVIIDGGLHSTGTPRHVRIQGLEVIVSENLTETRTTEISGSTPGWDRPTGGIDVNAGEDIALVNNIIHANLQGIGFWKNLGGGSEIYGNLIYDNGWIAPDRYHGHGIYSQNNSGDWKYIRDNILFDGYAMNINIYGTAASVLLDKYVVDRNIAWKGLGDERINIGGTNAPNEIRLRENVSYGSFMQIGYSGNPGDDIISTDNTLISSQVSYPGAHTNLTKLNNFEWDPAWNRPRLDNVTQSVPTDPMTFLNVNAYDSNRANLALVAFQGEAAVDVDMSSFLQVGDAYQLKDPSDFFGSAVVSGTYAGGLVSVLTSEQWDAPGNATLKFGKYVVLKQPASPNTDPTAVGDSAAVAEDSSVVIDILANDNDPDGSIDPSQVIILHDPNHGSVTVNGDGTVTYTPDADYFGADSFRYVARDNDGGISNRAVVNVTISEGNDLPSAGDDGPVEALTGMPVVIDVLGNDSDFDGTIDPASVVVTVGPGNGSAVVNANGTITYTSDAGFFGNDSLRYTVRDNIGGVSNEATVSITVSPATIIDNGDSGFQINGQWQWAAGTGYGSGSHYSAAGTGSNTATWTFSAEPGQYRLATTWQHHSNRAKNASFTVFDGSSALTTVRINQELAPNDFTDQGAAWEELGTFVITSDTVRVHLSNQADEYVFADAVWIERVGDLPTGSEIQVLSGKVDLMDGSSTVDFGNAALGNPITRTFTVRNLGLDPLTFGTPTVSAPGYTLVSGPASTLLQHGESTTFALRLDANASGTASGTISLVTNDSDENPFNFSVTGSVATAQIIDNGQAGFGLWGDGWQSLSGNGYGGDSHYSAAGTGKDAATWTFSVTPGAYQVATNWGAHVNRATNAPYTIYDGSTALNTVNINQELAPNDFTAQGGVWETLGIYQITGSKLTVNLSDLANEYVIADAVRVVRVGNLFEQVGDLPAGSEIQVLCGGVDIANGSGVVDFGSLTLDKPITKTFTVVNLGFDPLTLGKLIVSASAYTLVSGPASTMLKRGESTTFALRLDADASGTISLVTNDSDENPFSFSVRGSVAKAQDITSAAQIIDASEEPSDPKSEQLASAWAAVREFGRGSHLGSVGRGLGKVPPSFSVAPSQHRSLAFWMAHSNRFGVLGTSTNRLVHLSDAIDGPGHTGTRRAERIAGTGTMPTPEGVDELMSQLM